MYLCVVATFQTWIEDVELRITGGKPTDESRASWASIGTAIFDCAAYFLRKRLLETKAKSIYPSLTRSESSWYSALEIEVVQDTTRDYIILPQLPFATTDNYGIDYAYTRIQDNIKQLAIGDMQDADWVKSTPFGHINYVLVPKMDPKLGKAIAEVFPRSLIKSVTVHMILLAPDKGLSYEEALTREFPVPADMAVEIKDMAVKILRGELEIPDDKSNQGYDNSKPT